jgi:hypothetical protein
MNNELLNIFCSIYYLCFFNSYSDVLRESTSASPLAQAKIFLAEGWQERVQPSQARPLPEYSADVVLWAIRTTPPYLNPQPSIMVNR